MSEREAALELVRTAVAALERSRRRLDDLNVFPVPDGDTGTNMALTARAALEWIEAADVDGRAALADGVARATLFGARGNSGVILSQMVRGAADVVARTFDIAAALRGASDAAYDAVGEPVEGTMLTAIREAADEARAHASEAPAALLRAVVRRADEAVARTPEQLDVLREAGVVDAGAAGVAEVLRGIAAFVTGEPLPEEPAAPAAGVEAIHQEPSRYRYCTSFVVEGEALDAAALEQRLVPLGDSLLVVGDRRALKVHVHTDDPGTAVHAGTMVGVVEGVEIANMRRQAAAREERLLAGRPDEGEHEIPACSVVAVVTGTGNRVLFESLGARIVEGGRTMNPAARDIAAAVEEAVADEVLVLPNNPNVVLAAQQAASLAGKPVHVVESSSLQAGLAAMVAFDPARSAAVNAAEMSAALAGVATGAITVASRAVERNGLRIREGDYLGLVDGRPVAGGADFDAVTNVVASRLLAEPKDVLTLLTGEAEPELDRVLAELERRYPELELEVHPGGQPHYLLLLGAE